MKMPLTPLCSSLTISDLAGNIISGCLIQQVLNSVADHSNHIPKLFVEPMTGLSLWHIHPDFVVDNQLKTFGYTEEESWTARSSQQTHVKINSAIASSTVKETGESHDKETKAVLESEQLSMYEIYIARAAEIYSVPKTREIYEQAFSSEGLPEKDVIKICIKYAEFEKSPDHILSKACLGLRGVPLQDIARCLGSIISYVDPQTIANDNVSVNKILQSKRDDYEHRAEKILTEDGLANLPVVDPTSIDQIP
ncbi:hypothetical protein Tco_0522014 [Tanacetum coccineum]